MTAWSTTKGSIITIASIITITTVTTTTIITNVNIYTSTTRTAVSRSQLPPSRQYALTTTEIFSVRRYGPLYNQFVARLAATPCNIESIEQLWKYSTSRAWKLEMIVDLLKELGFHPSQRIALMGVLEQKLDELPESLFSGSVDRSHHCRTTLTALKHHCKTMVTSQSESTPVAITSHRPSQP
jgi:hypothetical protein